MRRHLGVWRSLVSALGFAITIEPALPAGEHVKVTAVGTDGTKQNFVTVVHADPN